MKKTAFAILCCLLLASCNKPVTPAEADALYKQGLTYWQGTDGQTKSPAVAVRYFLQAAQAGNTDAQVTLGYAYAKGLGAGENPAEALKWFTAAAQKGNRDAEYNAGLLYVRDENGRDYQKAAEWFEKAAEQGDAGASYNLAVMYVNAEGVERDPVRAYAWFDVAASLGDAESAKNRDELGGHLKPEQITEAKGFSKQFQDLIKGHTGTVGGEKI